MSSSQQPQDSEDELMNTPGLGSRSSALMTRAQRMRAERDRRRRIASVPQMTDIPIDEAATDSQGAASPGNVIDSGSMVSSPQQKEPNLSYSELASQETTESRTPVHPSGPTQYSTNRNEVASPENSRVEGLRRSQSRSSKIINSQLNQHRRAVSQSSEQDQVNSTAPAHVDNVPIHIVAPPFPGGILAQPPLPGGILAQQTQAISIESPIPQLIQRALGDRSYEKRKNAAVELETLVKSLAEPIISSTIAASTATLVITSQNSHSYQMIASIIQVLSRDFCSSMNSHLRKGGLIGLAACTIGLMIPPSFQVHATSSIPTNVSNKVATSSHSTSNNMPMKQQDAASGTISGSNYAHFRAQIPANFLVAHFLDYLLKPVLQCFDDPESRVRYYACESLYNIAKVARGAILQSFPTSVPGSTSPVHTKSNKRYFALIFDGLTKLFADIDLDVKNGANLLDRLIKDIVTETSDTSSASFKNIYSHASFQVEKDFLPLLQNYIKRTNPYIRQLLVGWITALDSIPDISMLDYLPEFLDGLFSMLSDTNREIRQAADSALGEFLREIRTSSVIEFGPIIQILSLHCQPSKDRLNRLTAIIWLAEIIDHPTTAGSDALIPFHAEIVVSFLTGISDVEPEIRKVSLSSCSHLLALIREKRMNDGRLMASAVALAPLLDALRKELLEKDDIPTKLASLQWINMLVEKRKSDMNEYVSALLPDLLKTLSDPSDDVILLVLQVLSRISMLPTKTNERVLSDGLLNPNGSSYHEDDDSNFVLVLNSIILLFAGDRKLLENRGTLIVRKLCVLLSAKRVYIRIADSLTSFEKKASIVDLGKSTGDSMGLDFIASMVQILNLILLTATELHSLRQSLYSSLIKTSDFESNDGILTNDLVTTENHSKARVFVGADLFSSLYRCWCHNPVAVFSLCLMAQCYDLAFALVKRFSDMDVTVGFLMQIDKLVQLLESPIFLHLRLQLLDVESPNHIFLLKSCYGLLMLLPQSDAFRCLNDRLTAVCNLRDNLGIVSGMTRMEEESVLLKSGLQISTLLDRFDEVANLHRIARESKAVLIPHEHDTSFHAPYLDPSSLEAASSSSALQRASIALQSRSSFAQNDTNSNDGRWIDVPH